MEDVRAYLLGSSFVCSRAFGMKILLVDKIKSELGTATLKCSAATATVRICSGRYCYFVKIVASLPLL